MLVVQPELEGRLSTDGEAHGAEVDIRGNACVHCQWSERLIGVGMGLSPFDYDLRGVNDF